MCFDCPRGRFSKLANQTSCAQCSIGAFQPLVRQTSCLHCLAGRYQGQRGQPSCSACRLGRFQARANRYNDLNCADCPAGKYRGGGRKLACAACPGAKFQRLPGKTHCDTYRYNFTIRAAEQDHDGPVTRAPTSAPTKFVCAAGRHRAASGRCRDCPAGKYQTIGAVGVAGDLGGVCKLCPAGKYQDVAGKWVCQRSPTPSPTPPTAHPTASPTHAPVPTMSPTHAPTWAPTPANWDGSDLSAMIHQMPDQGSFIPRTPFPTQAPTQHPTPSPTTATPTSAPTTAVPTPVPTSTPTASPSQTPAPTPPTPLPTPPTPVPTPFAMPSVFTMLDVRATHPPVPAAWGLAAGECYSAETNVSCMPCLLRPICWQRFNGLMNRPMHALR